MADEAVAGFPERASPIWLECRGAEFVKGEVHVKLYGQEPAGEARYSPPKCVGTRMEVKSGGPDPAHVSTSYAGRQNLNMRVGMRRFTRLTNALKTTPAVAAGVADHVWTITELVGLLDRVEARATETDSKLTHYRLDEAEGRREPHRNDHKPLVAALAHGGAGLQAGRGKVDALALDHAPKE
jgi:hypothetical protein